MRARVIVLTVVFAVASLVPALAQTTTGACSIETVNGLLQMSGDCSLTIHIGGEAHQVAMPSHLVPPPVGTGTTTNPQADAQAQRDAEIDSRRATKKSKRATKTDNQRAKKDRQHDRKRAKKTGATVVPTSTPTPTPKAQQAHSASLTPTPEIERDHKKQERREHRRAQDERIVDG